MAIPSTMAIAGTNSPNGQIVPGIHREVIGNVGATYQLQERESGALCLFDAEEGNTYTLPAEAQAGTYYDFAATEVVSPASKVIAPNGQFFSGPIFGDVKDKVEITANEAGDLYRVIKITDELWHTTGKK